MKVLFVYNIKILIINCIKSMSKTYIVSIRSMNKKIQRMPDNLNEISYS